MDLADGRITQRLTLVRRTAPPACRAVGVRRRTGRIFVLVAPMRGPGAVVDTVIPSAMILASMQLGVEGVEHVSVQITDFDATDERHDVPLDVCPIATHRAWPDPQNGQVTLQQLGDRCARAGTAALVHLVLQPGKGHLGKSASLRPRLDHLGEVVPALGDRVDARVDADP
jgi:hypothetical protein